MKNVKKLLCFVFVVVAVILLNNVNSYAAEVQYSDNLIPAMTSNTSPSGVVSASSVLNPSSGNYSEWKAFDASMGSGWLPDGKTGWLSYEFPEAKCVTKYTITSRTVVTDIGELPKDWTFEAWDSQSNEWVVLDMHANVTDWTIGIKKEFSFSNTKSYNKYRININVAVGSAKYPAIGKLEMMETITGPAIKGPKVVLEPKEELQLSVDDDLAENTKMTWTSSDATVATVDGNGVVAALKPGNTVITSTNEDGTYTESINVLVVEDAKDYRLAVDLKVGKSCRLTVDDYTNTVAVTWSTMDPTVATVSSKGKVTAVSKGLTIVTATDSEGKEIGQIYVRVRNN